MRWSIVFLACLFLGIQAEAKDSLTGRLKGYLRISQTAAHDPYYFQNFRSMSEYRIAFELEQGDVFAQYISHSKHLIEKLPAFQKLDFIGNPHLTNYPDIGQFTPTTLRYIVLADQIIKLFNLPPKANIVEIGAGFGGQSYILSQLCPFSKYYIYDLPEVEMLIEKVLETLEVSHAFCLPIDQEVPEKKIDLLISNYAFSECDKEMQMEYFEKVIKKADRGYIIYNNIAAKNYSLSLKEFVQLLKNIGLSPRVFKELFCTAPDNFLVIWDKTKLKSKKAVNL